MIDEEIKEAPFNNGEKRAEPPDKQEVTGQPDKTGETGKKRT